MQRIAVLAVLLLAGSSALQAERLVGLITFAMCAEEGKATQEVHAKCAEGEDRDDHVLVFVDEKDPKKVYELLFEEPADPFVGQLVVIEGVVEDNFLEIETIQAQK